MYDSTHWRDRIEDTDTGELIQEGTKQSAGNFNKMEEGILDSHISAKLNMIALYQVSD